MGAGTAHGTGLTRPFSGGAMRYIVGRYHRIGSVEYQAGQVLEIDDPEYAAWLGRDMRGYLTLVVPEPEPQRAIETPPHDRQARKPARRRGAA